MLMSKFATLKYGNYRTIFLFKAFFGYQGVLPLWYIVVSLTCTKSIWAANSEFSRRSHLKLLVRKFL